MEAVYVSYLWEVWTAQSKKNFLGDFALLSDIHNMISAMSLN